MPMTSERKWTKGPWLAAAKPSSVVGWPIVAPHAMGRSICSVNYVQHSAIDPAVPGDKAFNSESKANAHLIAAAPELYEALDRVADLFKFLASDPSTETGWDTDENLEAWEQASAALAKALGDPR